VSADLSVVPAFPARDLGLDRGMVGAYGQDDRACVYPALTALLSLEQPEYTSCVVLADKEEASSDGISGMRCSFFRDFIEEIAVASAVRGAGNSNTVNSVTVAAILRQSFCLSADVSMAWHPRQSAILDPHGEAALNKGVVLFKYWGKKGKEITNDAHAETTAALRNILDKAGIIWQTGQGGKVDAIDSGTLSRFFAALNIPTIDLGVAILSMHSPLEAAAKTDVYMAHRAFAAFFNRN
jgi:aspartyl aminopeptidase